MSKDYKGYELIKAIRDGEIIENSVIEVHSLSVGDNVITEIKYINRRLIWDAGEFNTGFLCDDNYYFRVVEEQKEIDIQSLKETNIEKDCSGIEYYTYSNKNNTETGYSVNYSLIDIETRKKINELVQAVKQLDKNIKEK